MSDAKVTTDHDAIRRWAEERDGRPATVAATAEDGTDDRPGVLRIDFGPERAEGLRLLSWDAFFEKFDAEKLGFLHQDRTSGGGISRFHKFVDRS